MKKLLFTLIALIGFAGLMAQTTNQFIGSYNLNRNKGGDAASFYRLYVLPNNVFMTAYFGGGDMGTWKQCHNYLILEPDTLFNEHFYVHQKLEKSDNEAESDSISINFNNCNDEPILYRFVNSKDKTQTEPMHPIYNRHPNCIKKFEIKIAKGKYDRIELMAADQALYYNIPESEENNLNYTGTRAGKLYTFPLDNNKGEITVKFYQKATYPFAPILANFVGDQIRINGQTLGSRSELSDKELEESKQMQQMYLNFLKTGIDGDIPQIEEFKKPDRQKRVMQLSKQDKEVKHDMQPLFNYTCKDYNSENSQSHENEATEDN